MRRDVTAAFVEKLLAGISGGGLVEPDADGDYPVRYRSALYYVRLVGDGHVDVQVFAVAVDGVDASPGLLAAVNDINAQIRFVRVFHVQGQVLVEADITGDAIEPSGFYTACEAVATVTDRVGPQLAAEHGGRTAFEDSKENGYRPREELIGMYL
jgi:hypothetical protein